MVGTSTLSDGHQFPSLLEMLRLPAVPSFKNLNIT